MTLKMVPKTTLPLPNWWIHWNVVVLPKALNEFVHWQVCQSSLVMSNGYDGSVSLGPRYLNTEISFNHVVSIRSNFWNKLNPQKNTTHNVSKNNLMGHSQPLFRLFEVFSNKRCYFFNKCEKWPYSIWCRD